MGSIAYKSGDVYNGLVLTGKSYTDAYGHRLVECICLCDKIIYKRIDALLKGKTKLCGDQMCELLNGGLSFSKGDVYGKLTLTGITQLVNKNRYVEVICECGNKKMVSLSSLKVGDVKSCGCFSNQMRKDKMTTHGMSNSKTNKVHPILSAFQNMHRRCEGVVPKDYINYTQKGIVVCEEWFDFDQFKNWALANGWKKGLTLERKDSNKNYCPENCIWDTYTVQNRNTSRNVYITAFSETKCVAEWTLDERCKVGEGGLRKRLKNEWLPELAISKPSQKK